MIDALNTNSVESFYRAALVGLRLLDLTGRRRRRFGEEADARWRGFAGNLTVADRIDLLIHDAAVSWDAAFSPRRVFRLQGLADDEPFGPDWPWLPPADAQKAWKWAEGLEWSSWREAADLICDEWFIDADAQKVSMDKLTPASRVVAAGPSALLALAQAFTADEALSWSDQVAVVAVEPGHRHLAGLTALLVSSHQPTRLIDPDRGKKGEHEPIGLIRAAGLSGVDLYLTSDDSDEPSLDFVETANPSRSM